MVRGDNNEETFHRPLEFEKQRERRCRQHQIEE
jgi:hypothetical protein